MKYLRIFNDGEIDTNALFLLGASTKRGDSEKIGFFGSGNKYAVATLLRKGVPFRVFSGEREILFETQPVTYRNETFGVIFIDGQKSSFTTSMGPTWETWFALREFISNAKDEGGYSLDCTEQELRGQEGVTQICIEMTEEIQGFYDSLNLYIRTDDELESVDTSEGIVDIIPKQKDALLVVYRKGIRANHTETKYKSVVNYDFDKLSINESRVYNSDFDVKCGMAGALLACSDKGVIERYLEVKDDDTYVESLLTSHFQIARSVSDTWGDVIGDTLVVADGRSQHMPADDLYGALILKDELVTKLAAHFPNMRIAGRDGYRFDLVLVTQEFTDRVTKALAFLARLGYHENGFIIVPVKFWDGDMIAQYIQRTKTCCLGVDKLGDDDVLIATLFEELAHHNTGYGDGERIFEQWIIEQVIFQGRRALKEFV